MKKPKAKIHVQMFQGAGCNWWTIFLGGAQCVSLKRSYVTRKAAERAAIRWCEKIGVKWEVVE